MQWEKGYERIIAVMVLLALTLWFMPDALADGAPNCTSSFVPQAPPSGQGGIFSSIVTQVMNILNNLAHNMFIGITGDSGFQEVITAAITIYIAIYGVLFTFGMVQITLFDFAMRMVKIAIVGMLVGGANAWYYFSLVVIPFFQTSTYTIINWVTAIAVGPMAGCTALTATGQMNLTAACTTPFSVLDSAIGQAISANMLVTAITTFTTLPYGPLIGLMVIMAAGTFLKAMISALWVYTMSLIMQALLFGMAPIFLAFLLFNRTRHLFDGWLNQLINSLLQPVLLFTFLGFFVTLILACINSLLSYNICWTNLPQTINGTPFGTQFWRFNVAGAPAANVSWGFNGPNVPGQPIFPIPIMLPLMFWILSDLCSRSIDMCVQAAQNLSSASTDLRMGSESLAGWFSGIGGGGGGESGGGRSGGGGGLLGGLFGGGGGGGDGNLPPRDRPLPGNPPVNDRPNPNA